MSITQSMTSPRVLNISSHVFNEKENNNTQVSHQNESTEEMSDFH